jgi:lipopolysaccharide transport system ATP-binding protein
MTKAIRVENLSKRYYIGQGKTARYETLSERITDMLTSPIRSMRSVLQGQSSAVASDSIWALKDVSFEVEHGEVVGIIGRNGAGKSTLLKILSQITEPTEGHIDLYGRVGALLEVGTGFHPELTGRENVFLNGAILGMTRNDIQRKFDEIVDFSGVEKFIDTPVKHYSSGMQVRLAFAVAAHLEPEILVVDEVLAVGDAEFQKKCLGKMGDVTKEGRTVLFVSHNMGAVQQLCRRGVVLEKGQNIFYGTVEASVERYLESITEVSGCSATFPVNANKPIQILEIMVSDEMGCPTPSFKVGERIQVYVTYQVHQTVYGANLALIITYKGTEILCSFDTDVTPEYLNQRVPGIYKCKVSLPVHVLKAGLYTIHIGTGMINKQAFELHKDVVSFVINEISEDTSFKGYAERRTGVLRIPVIWDR